jgi:hypothetical protein
LGSNGGGGGDGNNIPLNLLVSPPDRQPVSTQPRPWDNTNPLLYKEPKLNKPIVLNVESNNNNSRVISSWSSTY